MDCSVSMEWYASGEQQYRIHPHDHPHEKPVALYNWIFARYAKPGDRILDPFLGSGSSRIAAHDAGLDFVGIESNETYFAGEEDRFRRHKAQVNLFLENGD